MRKVPLGRFAITGRFPSRYSDAPLQYESALEGKFLAILDSDVLLKSIATQQPTVMVDVGGKERKYTPDVLVTWRSDVEWPYGSQTVAFEVKPFAILRDKHYSLAPKLRAARQVLKEIGIGFRVITDRSIETPRLVNARKMIEARSYRPKDEWYNAASEVFRWRQEPFELVELENVLLRAGARPFEAQEFIWHWVSRGFIECDLNRPVTGTTKCLWWTMLVLQGMPRHEEDARD